MRQPGGWRSAMHALSRAGYGETVNPRDDFLSRLADSSAVTMLEPLYTRAATALERKGLAERLRAQSVLGHTAHPILTDLPLGLWTATSVLDVLGGKRSRPARTLLCALGVATAAPTALTGLADWSRLEGEERRLGVVHAAGNAIGVLCYAESTKRRLFGQHVRGTLVAGLGAAVMAGAGYVGGELALNRGAARGMAPRPPAPTTTNHTGAGSTSPAGTSSPSSPSSPTRSMKEGQLHG